MKWWWIVIGVILFAITQMTMDPDLGWHLRMGQYIALKGIPATDPLSYTMSNFLFVDHEWVTNTGMYWLNKLGGIRLLGLITTLLAMWALNIAIPKKWKKWQTIPILLTASVLIPRFGIRPQVEDWLLFPLVARWFGEDGRWAKWRWGYPILMMVWANLHGGFALGIAAAITVWGVRCWEEKRLRTKELIIIGFGIGATFINPYGWRLWEEVYRQMTDKYARNTLMEWLPFYYVVELGYVMMLVLVATLGAKFGNKVGWWRVAVATGTGLASLFSLRHAPLFMISGSSVISGSWQYFYNSLNSKVKRERAEKIYRVLIFFCVAAVALSTVREYSVVKIMTEKNYFPKQAVEYIRSHPPKGNILTEYGKGGYMIWKLPEYKVFIDGRMNSWRWKSPDPKYADYIFEDYLKIVQKGDYKDIFSKYGITTVIWDRFIKSSSQPVGLNIFGKEFTINWNIYYGEIFISKLLEDGWIKIYEDKTAVIYETPNLSNTN